MTQTVQDADFTRLADPYRRELFAHCYRMLGSLHDAEDLVQETYLRAWRAYDGFESRSSLRTWLHRIATNVCLTALEGRSRRPLPSGLGASSSEPGETLLESYEVPWLEPVPDALVDSDDVRGADPATVVTTRESVRLAFIAALQHLPPRQRAVLILREVLQWSAAEVADALALSTAAVNSLLQRARAQLAAVGPVPDRLAEPDEPQRRELLDRWVSAFWEKDIATIVTLLTEDAVWEMPPYLSWYQGPQTIGRLIDVQCPGGRHEMRLVPTRANGQPAFGLYMRDNDGQYLPFQLQVLDIPAERRERVAHVVAFFDVSLFAHFGLPARLPDR